jgi:hypothetical protein
MDGVKIPELNGMILLGVGFIVLGVKFHNSRK